MKKVSIKDVAREAGVSITTVSRALNGYPDVSEKTKKIIHEVVEHLNYAPDINARSLGGKAETTIALITSELLPENENGFVYGLISGLFEKCTELGCEFMLLATNAAKQEKLSFLQLCKKKNLSGVVVTGLRIDDPYYQEIISSEIPCAMIDMSVNSKNKCEVGIDNVLASKEAVNYLIELGHHHIGMLNGGKTAYVSGQRYSGYVSALLDHNIPLQMDYMRHCDFSERIAFQETTELMRQYPEITAFFCASDLMAIGAIHSLESLGFRVPKDVSVIGFDDMPIAKYVHKGITTIRQSPREMGLKGGEAVWDMIQNISVPSKLLVTHQLIVRGTTSALTTSE